MIKDIEYILLDGRNEQITFKDKLFNAIDGLKEGQGIHVIKDFEPTPIYDVMEQKGFSRHVDRVSDKEYHVYFYPKDCE